MSKCKTVTLRKRKIKNGTQYGKAKQKFPPLDQKELTLLFQITLTT